MVASATFQYCLSIQLFISLFSTAKAPNLKQTCCFGLGVYQFEWSLCISISFGALIWEVWYCCIKLNWRVDCPDPFLAAPNCCRMLSPTEAKGWGTFGAFWLLKRTSRNQVWFVVCTESPSFQPMVCRVESILYIQNCRVNLALYSLFNHQNTSPVIQT